MALGSATHKRSSCMHASMASVESSNTKCRNLFDECVAYPKRTVPMNGIPKILEESLLCPSSIFALYIPLVSLKGFTFSAVDLQEKVEGAKFILRGHTENPRWVHRPRYIPDRRKPPAPSKKGVNEECGTSCECSKLVLHGQLAVSGFTVEKSEESRGSYRLASGPKVTTDDPGRTRYNPPAVIIRDYSMIEIIRLEWRAEDRRSVIHRVLCTYCVWFNVTNWANCSPPHYII